LAKNFIGELEFDEAVEQELEDLEEQREVLIKHLTREKE
jgi:hypothetical protein